MPATAPVTGPGKGPAQGLGQGSGKSPAKGRSPARRRALKILKWFLIVAISGTLLLVAAFIYLYKTTSIPNPNKDFQTQSSFVYYGDGKTEIGQYATQNRQIIPLREMPKQLQNAVIAAEDRTFYTNHGIDPKGIIRAAFNDARGGATQGASTITQQYVKILYLTQERSLSRKVHEAILSLKLQKQQSKDEILEGYLNTIYFGRGAYGVQAAAQRLLRRRRRRPHPQAERGAGERAEQPDRSTTRPTARRTRRRCSPATATCSAAWPRWARSPLPRRPRRRSTFRRSRCSSSPASTPARRATC